MSLCLRQRYLEKCLRADGPRGNRATGSETAHRALRFELDAARQSALRDRAIFRSPGVASSFFENGKRDDRFCARFPIDRDLVGRLAGGPIEMEDEPAIDER